MEVKELSTIIYDQLSEVNIMKFGHTYPIPLAILSFWYHKYEINGDKILSTPNNSKAEDLLKTIKLCTNLKKLTLKKDYKIELLKKIPSTIATNCPKITHLILEETILYVEEILALRQCTTLEDLRVRSYVKDKTYEDLFPCLPNLRHLKIKDDSYKLKGSCLMKLPKTLKGLQLYDPLDMDLNILLKSIQLLNLKLLHLYNLDNEMDDFLPTLARVAPHLQDLLVCMYLDNCNALGEFKHLTKLELFCEFYISDSDIESITENCTLLIELKINEIPESLTESAFGSIGKLPNLKRLSFFGKVIEFSPHLPSLYKERMSGLSKCVKLETLSISFCGLTNYAATIIILGCTLLSSFTIEKCKVTTGLIQEIATELHKGTTRTTKLALNLYNAEPERSLPEKLEFTGHPLLDVTIREITYRGIIEVFRRQSGVHLR